jgi:phospholipase/carboxylesterase
MQQQLLPCVEIDPPGTARSAVIWLHGLGADGHDFESIVPMLGLKPEDAVRFVFPHAPKIPVTVNMGAVMPAWYDIEGLDFDRMPDEAGVQRSSDQVRALIERENERGVPSERIVLAGFSQGGAIALHLGLRYEEPLAGILALSTYLATEATLAAERSEKNRAIPIFQAHGTMDPMVPFGLGTRTRDRLQADGYPLEWAEYPMEHQVCPEEIEAVGAWLRARLA